MKPNYAELAFILLIGVLQPVIELLYSSRISTYYNVVAAVLVIAYVIFRMVRSGSPIFFQWGFRTDNFWKSVPPFALFSLLAVLVLYGYGWSMGNTPLPIGFWYVLILYPIWGIAQQFVLQNFVARNLEAIIPSVINRSLIVALIFASAHIPSIELFSVAFVAGFFFTYLFHRSPNLFALGIAHGILGALVFHLVLGQDQWLILQQYFL
jgi:membrane protease YdiL (CAAX protease family)